MLRLCLAMAAFIFWGCSNDTEFNENSTSVVITKNPKGGSGGGTGETRYLQLTAPWLDPATTLMLEVSAIQSVDQNGNREVVGVLDPGTYVQVSSTQSGKIQFNLETEMMRSLKSLEIVSQRIYAKNNRRGLSNYAGSQVYSLEGDFEVLTSARPVYLAPPQITADATCKISTQLSIVPPGTSAPLLCGGRSKSGDKDDDDDDDDDDYGSD